jgi:predicted tellurium resistance membrane protein TerC
MITIRGRTPILQLHTALNAILRHVGINITVEDWDKFGFHIPEYAASWRISW